MSTIEKIRNYLISYKKSGETVWTRKVIENNTDDNFISSTQLTGLLPSTEYEIRIAIKDPATYAYSGFSNTAIVSTLAQGTYSITNCRELQAIGQDPVTKELGDLEGKYILANDIDCTESKDWVWDGVMVAGQEISVKGFFPISDLENVTFGSGFRGTLDGNGHHVANLVQETNSFGGVFSIFRECYSKKYNI
jgi:hypothetical protein